jgi:hypothetical protein
MMRQQPQCHIDRPAKSQSMLPCALSLLLMAFVPAFARAGAPSFEYSQDGVHYQPVQILSSPTSAPQYYDYYNHAGHPSFGVVDHTQTVCLYFDSTDGSLSLIFISGGGKGDHGRGTVTLTGLPHAAHLTLSDEPDEFHLSRKLGTLTGDFIYGDATDGFVVGDLQAATRNFTARLNVSSSRGIKNLRLTDGDPLSGADFIPLDRDQPLYIRSLSIGHGHGGHPGAGGGVGSGNTGGNAGGGNVGGVGTPVPEPCGLTAIMLAVANFLKRSRRRCRPSQRARP